MFVDGAANAGIPKVESENHLDDAEHLHGHTGQNTAWHLMASNVFDKEIPRFKRLQWQGKYIASHQLFHSRASIDASVIIKERPIEVPHGNHGLTDNEWLIDDYLLNFPAHSTTTRNSSDDRADQLSSPGTIFDMTDNDAHEYDETV